MILYHGSNKTIAKPDLGHSRINGKDFGAGFYLSDSLDMAWDFAKKVSHRNRCSNAVVSRYEIRLDRLDTCDLRILAFKKPTSDWFIYIYKNRHKLYSSKDYDIVIGPVADSGLPEKLAEYERLRNRGEAVDLELFAKSIKFKAFSKSFQYCFKSEAALKILKYIQR